MSRAVTVSLIMPVYNRAKLLSEAARSILDGTFKDLELVAIDDGSTDDSLQELEKLAAADGRVKVLRQPNSGAYAARNAAAAVASGKYLAMQDADDVSLPDRLERQITRMEAQPQLAALGGGLLMIDSRGQTIRTVQPPQSDREIKAGLKEINPIHTTTVMLRRDVFNSVAGFRPIFRAGGDYDLWLRLAERFELGNLPQPLARYRVHGDQISLRKLRAQVQGMLASSSAAKIRAQGRPDPLESAAEITPQLLETMGVDGATVDAAELSACFWWSDLMCDANDPAAAARLLERAAELANGNHWVIAKVCRAYARIHSMRQRSVRRVMAKAAARLAEYGCGGAAGRMLLSAAGA